jgi:L,D-transpeptidase ErfK/SrfK
MTRLDLSRRQVITGLAAAAGAALIATRTATAARGGTSMVGEVGRTTAKAGDTLMDIMRRHNLGFDEILAANPGFDVWTPAEGTEVVLPTAHILPDAPREGMVLNLPEHRLYFFPPNGGKPESYAIGIGTEGNKTPLGRTKVVRKQKKPTWYVPKSILAEEPGRQKVVPPGPDNPLGDHAIYLAWTAYLIHGTNLPDAIGRRASHGCINMYPEGIAAIFERTPIGMPVTVVDQQAKLAWVGEQLLMQVHLSGRQADQIEETGKFDHEPVPKLEAIADKAAGEERHRLDWEVIQEAVKRRDGIPVNVLRDTPA